MAAQLKLQIIVDDKGARIIDQLGNKVEGVGRQGKASFEAMGQGANRMNSYVEKSIAVYNRLMVAAGALYTLKQGWDLMNTAARAAQEKQAFEALAQSYGSNADKIVADLKRASAQTIDTMTLIEKAGTAMMMGINPEEISKLMEIARATSRMTGQTVTKAFEDISLAVGRQSRMILDNLGIIVKVGDANQKYAAELGKTVGQLTETEKKQAFLNATIAAGEDLMRRMGDQTKTAAEALQTMEAFAQDLKVMLGEGLLFVLKWLLIAFAQLGAVVNRTLEQIAEGWSYIAGLIAMLPGGEALGFKALSDKLKSLSEHFKEARIEGEAFVASLYNMKLTGGPTPAGRVMPPSMAGGALPAPAGATAAGAAASVIAQTDDLEAAIEARRMGRVYTHYQEQYRIEQDALKNHIKVAEQMAEAEKQGWDVAAKSQEKSVKEMSRTMQDFAENSKWTVSEVFFDAMGRDLKSFGDYWESFWTRMKNSLARTFADMTVNWAMGGLQNILFGGRGGGGGLLGGALGALGGAIGGAASGAVSKVGSWIARLFHEGGIVGMGGPTSALRAGEILSILELGEAVMTKDQVKALQGALGGSTQAVNAFLTGGTTGGLPGTSGIPAGQSFAPGFNLDFSDVFGFTNKGGIKGAFQNAMAMIGFASPKGTVASIVQGLVEAIASPISLGEQGAIAAAGGYAQAWGGDIGVSGAGGGSLGGAPGAGTSGAPGAGEGFGFGFGMRYGGLVRGPETGYEARLHGTEMVVSQKRGVPARVDGGGLLGGALGALGGAIGGAVSEAVSKVGSWIARLFHEGGIVGMGGLTSALRAGEILSILEPGEAVMTKDQVKALQGALGGSSTQAVNAFLTGGLPGTSGIPAGQSFAPGFNLDFSDVFGFTNKGGIKGAFQNAMAMIGFASPKGTVASIVQGLVEAIASPISLGEQGAIAAAGDYAQAWGGAIGVSGAGGGSLGGAPGAGTSGAPGAGEGFGFGFGMRYGGPARDPESGYEARLHGTEMVVSQKRGVPAQVDGGGPITITVPVYLDGNLVSERVYEGMYDRSKRGAVKLHPKSIDGYYGTVGLDV